MNWTNNITFNLGTLAAGSSAMMTVYAAPQSLGLFTNVVSISTTNYNLTPAGSMASVTVNVYVQAPPVITAQPVSQILNLGGILNLAVGAVGPPGLRYQWRLNGVNIPGATNATYALVSLLAGNCGNYTVVVSDLYGAITSQAALVSLNGLLVLPASDKFSTKGLALNVLGLISVSNVGATSKPASRCSAGCRAVNRSGSPGHRC